MKKHVSMLVVVVGLLLLGTVASAQEKSEYTPLKVQVVLSRYQGDKRISNMPYTLSVNAPPTTANPNFGTANLRMGAKIPVVMFVTAFLGGEKMPAAGPIQYQDVGTNIDCIAMSADAGRFRLHITIDDTSIYPDDAAKKNDGPSFRTFKATDSMILKDGQSAQFTAAVDKVSGEVTRVDVTLTVVK